MTLRGLNPGKHLDAEVENRTRLYPAYETGLLTRTALHMLWFHGACKAYSVRHGRRPTVEYLVPIHRVELCKESV